MPIENEGHPDLKPTGALVEQPHDYESISDTIGSVILEKPQPFGWWLSLGAGIFGVSILGISLAYLLLLGTGVWSVNIPVAWGFAIVNFVWWIGIGHAGTLISAILLLLRQDWRNAINRFAEAMTIFAVACAGMFPILHMGRPWVGFFILPYPNTMGLWPQFRSPLLWDVFAISTYGSVSLLFWYLGLIPDFAMLRDRAKNIWVKRIYGSVSLGWRGSAMHWHRYEIASLMLAGLCTPLVVSVHSIVSFDFAVGVLPGWHTTIFPPYFVAGAIYAGFAMVLTIMLPVRKWYKLESIITLYHIDNMSKVMLATSLIVAYGYCAEAFFAFYTGNNYEMFMMWNRMWSGPYAPAYQALIFCNIITPQLLWIKSIRNLTFMGMGAWPLWIITIIVGIGMWLERYVIVITSLTRDFMPSSWGTYHGTIWDWGFYIGTLGFFTTCMCLFIRFLPITAVHEVRVSQHQITGHGHH
jgi:molybdopterin-containing oxidoreductase family membrane subunit